MPVLPKHATDVEHFQDATLAPPVGSGPYIIADVRPGARLLLAARSKLLGQGRPSQRGFYNFDEIDITYFRDANALVRGLQGGLIDYARRAVPRAGPAAMTSRPRGKVESSRRSCTTTVQGMEASPSICAANRSRRSPARSARHDVRLRVDKRQSIFGLYTRTKSFFDQSELASIGRPATRAERALLAPFPDAVREDILEGRWRPPVNDGTGRDREMANGRSPS